MTKFNRGLFTFATLLLLSATGALAFGTINSFGQNAEHERITRHALGCGQPGGPAPDLCFKNKALNDFAGRANSWGAVGAPDNPLNGRISDPKSHCDDGDYHNTPGYPRSAAVAQNAIEQCRQLILTSIAAAVRDAAHLVRDHALVGAEIPTFVTCTFTYTKGRAYCNVLENFGAALHASQDFYSHSNWSDQQDSSKPLSVVLSGRQKVLKHTAPSGGRKALHWLN